MKPLIIYQRCPTSLPVIVQSLVGRVWDTYLVTGAELHIDDDGVLCCQIRAIPHSPLLPADLPALNLPPEQGMRDSKPWRGKS